jgi:hypothetical protein
MWPGTSWSLHVLHQMDTSAAISIRAGTSACKLPLTCPAAEPRVCNRPGDVTQGPSCFNNNPLLLHAVPGGPVDRAPLHRLLDPPAAALLQARGAPPQRRLTLNLCVTSRAREENAFAAVVVSACGTDLCIWSDGLCYREHWPHVLGQEQPSSGMLCSFTAMPGCGQGFGNRHICSHLISILSRTVGGFFQKWTHLP